MTLTVSTQKVMESGVKVNGNGCYLVVDHGKMFNTVPVRILISTSVLSPTTVVSLVSESM